jgi:hypothetical protein
VKPMGRDPRAYWDATRLMGSCRGGIYPARILCIRSRYTSTLQKPNLDWHGASTQPFRRPPPLSRHPREGWGPWFGMTGWSYASLSQPTDITPNQCFPRNSNAFPAFPAFPTWTSAKLSDYWQFHGQSEPAIPFC